MFRTLLFAVFVASASAFSSSPAFVRPTAISTSLGMADEKFSHGLSGPKIKHDMANTSSTDSQTDDLEVKNLENAAVKAKEAVKGAVSNVKQAVDDAVDKVSGDK